MNIEIGWPSIARRIRIVLDDQHNQGLVEAVCSALPYRTLQGHALVAGDCVYHVPPAHGALDAVPDHRVDRQAAPVGTVFCSAVQHLTIKYGNLTEPMPASPIGQVMAEDLPLLPEVGRLIWASVHGGGEPVIAHVQQLDAPSGHRVRRLPCLVAGDLVEAIAAATEAALCEAPEELIAVHSGRIESGAGTKESLLTTLVFVNGETRPLGYMTYTGLVRAARLTDIPISALVDMAKTLLVKPSEFLGYCGLTTLWSFTQRVIGALDSVTTRDDFVALTAHMALYVNALGAWNLQLFPWSLERGEAVPQTSGGAF